MHAARTASEGESVVLPSLLGASLGFLVKSENAKLNSAESSLALAHYVSGYVTKAERSNMQEIWQELSASKSVYSRLWSFGVRNLRFRECGLYE